MADAGNIYEEGSDPRARFERFIANPTKSNVTAVLTDYLSAKHGQDLCDTVVFIINGSLVPALDRSMEEGAACNKKVVTTIRKLVEGKLFAVVKSEPSSTNDADFEPRGTDDESGQTDEVDDDGTRDDDVVEDGDEAEGDEEFQADGDVDVAGAPQGEATRASRRFKDRKDRSVTGELKFKGPYQTTADLASQTSSQRAKAKGKHGGDRTTNALGRFEAREGEKYVHSILTKGEKHLPLIEGSSAKRTLLNAAEAMANDRELSVPACRQVLDMLGECIRSDNVIAVCTWYKDTVEKLESTHAFKEISYSDTMLKSEVMCKDVFRVARSVYQTKTYEISDASNRIGNMRADGSVASYFGDAKLRYDSDANFREVVDDEAGLLFPGYKDVTGRVNAVHVICAYRSVPEANRQDMDKWEAECKSLVTRIERGTAINALTESMGDAWLLLLAKKSWKSMLSNVNVKALEVACAGIKAKEPNIVPFLREAAENFVAPLVQWNEERQSMGVLPKCYPAMANERKYSVNLIRQGNTPINSLLKAGKAIKKKAKQDEEVKPKEEDEAMPDAAYEEGTTTSLLTH